MKSNTIFKKNCLIKVTGRSKKGQKRLIRFNVINTMETSNENTEILRAVLFL